MKKYRFILPILSLFICISTFGQTLYQNEKRVSISVKNKPLIEVLNQIKQQTGINLVYNNELMEKYKSVSLNVSKSSINETLKKLFLTTDLSYSINENTVIITLKQIDSFQAISKQVISGKVVDENDQPLPFANVSILELSQAVLTGSKGEFRFSVEKTKKSEFTVVASYIGKQPKKITINPLLSYSNLVIKMDDASLYLKEISVSANKAMSGNSNSSIFFNRELIEQTQALSLADVLNQLPGKSITAPSITNPNILTLRSVAGDSWSTDVFSRNNAFGVTYILDGVQLSNDANMQAQNQAVNGFLNPYIQGEYGLGLNNRNTTTSDNAFSGNDMRQISVDNIESIEVISGVASAKYGDYTDGAVIINRQAGRSPYNMRVSLRNGTTQYSLSKGLQLSKKLGAINYDVNYLKANNDPRDNLKSYNRVSARIMHSIALGANDRFKNTFSMGLSANLDGTKLDIDDPAERKSRFEYKQFTFSNRLSYQFAQSAFFKKVDFSVGLSTGRQYSSMQYRIAGESFPYVEAYKEGLNVGDYANGYYLGETVIEGKPFTSNANLNLSAEYKTLNINHRLSIGANAYYSDNFGRGQIIDPSKPLFSSSTEQSYNYNQLKGVLNVGAYLEDGFAIPLFNSDLNVRTGIRVDQQNKALNFSPRINTNYKITDKLTLGFSYGIATKAPSLAHLSPGPIYFHTPLIRANNEDPDKRLYLVYTNIINPENNQLKPSRSNTAEFSTSFISNGFNFSFSAYIKNTKDGFSTKRIIKEIVVPSYTYYINDEGKAAYSPTGGGIKRSISYNQMINSQNTNNKGLEFMISTPKIPAISTSFSISAGYTNSFFYDTYPYMNIVNMDGVDFTRDAVFAVYEPENRRNIQWRTNISSNTHIPSLGLMIGIIGDFPFKTKSVYYNRSAYPIGYYNAELKYFPIENFDPDNPVYGHLALLPTSPERENERYPIIYGNVHLRMSKEIAKRLRFSFNVYNMLNWRPKYTVESSGNLVVLNSSPSFGAEISLKL